MSSLFRRFYFVHTASYELALSIRSHFGSRVLALACAFLAPFALFVVRLCMTTVRKRADTATTYEYGHTSHLTARALSGVFADIRRLGIPDAISRNTIARDRRRFCFLDTAHGKVIQTLTAVGKKTASVSIPFQHPFAFLWAACELCDAFRMFFSEVLDAHNGHLSIIYYADEIDCGRATPDVKTREVLAVYWSIREFGPFILSQENAWFCMMALRTETIGRIQDGMQQLTTLALKELIIPLESHGVVFSMPHGGTTRILLGRLVMIIQDEKAHKYSFGVKGAAGTKFCAMCSRYVAPGSTLLPDPTGYCISGDTIILDQAQLHTNDTVRAMIARLKDVSDEIELCMLPLEKAKLVRDLETMEKNFGYTYSPFSPMVDAELQLDLMDVWGWDWMHCYYSSGVFGNELVALMKALDKHGIGSQSLHGYVKLFEWPKCYANPKAVFQPGSSSEDYSPSGTASEYLSVSAIVALYIRSSVLRRNVCMREALSMLALTEVTDLLILASRGKIRDADRLEEAIHKHLRLHQEAYGSSIWKPKLHYILHLPDSLREHGFLPAVFVQERKHRVIKRHATHRHASMGYDTGVLEEVTAKHLYNLRTPYRNSAFATSQLASDRMRDTIVSEGACSPTDEVRTSSVCCVNSRQVSIGDVVLFESLEFGNGVAEVYFHVEIAGVHISCISIWSVLEKINGTAKCVVRDCDVHLVRSNDIVTSVVYSRATVGNVSTVLVPVLC